MAVRCGLLPAAQRGEHSQRRRLAGADAFGRDGDSLQGGGAGDGRGVPPALDADPGFAAGRGRILRQHDDRSAGDEGTARVRRWSGEFGGAGGAAHGAVCRARDNCGARRFAGGEDVGLPGEGSRGSAEYQRAAEYGGGGRLRRTAAGRAGTAKPAHGRNVERVRGGAVRADRR